MDKEIKYWMTITSLDYLVCNMCYWTLWWFTLYLHVSKSLCKYIQRQCHNCDIWSTLYHPVWLCPHVYCPFHCMYLCFLIVSILLVLPPIGKCSVCSISPYNYLICFHLWFQLLTVPIPIYLLIQYVLGIWSPISPSLLIVLHELHLSLFIGIPDPPSIALYILL